MVYRSLGKAVPQTEIWPAIAKQTASGSLASMTHLMAQDAVNRGFHAVAIQARHPLQVLRLCREWGIRAVLNHHLQREAPAGHYSVLVDLDDKGVVLHDPFYGPLRRLPHAELLELWLPHSRNSEILGNVVIGIAAGPSAAPACEFCRTPIPSHIGRAAWLFERWLHRPDVELPLLPLLRLHVDLQPERAARRRGIRFRRRCHSGGFGIRGSMETRPVICRSG
jgi:hypothetical protein